MAVVEVSSGQTKNRSDVLELAEYSSAEGFIQKIFHKEKLGVSNHFFTLSATAEIDDSDRTEKLIATASRAIETLSSRCEILEAELEHEKANCCKQDTYIEKLKQMLLDFEARKSTLESELKSSTIRYQKAESRVVELEQAQKIVTLRASKAESISSKLQQQVEAAFGQGSPIRAVMESVKLQQAAE